MTASTKSKGLSAGRRRPEQRSIHGGAASQRSEAFQRICGHQFIAAIGCDACKTRHSDTRGASTSSITSRLGKAPNRVFDRQSPGTIQHLSATRPPSNGNILNSGGPQQVQDQGMSKLCSLAVSLSLRAECFHYRQPSLKPPRVSFRSQIRFSCGPAEKLDFEHKGHARILRQRTEGGEGGMGRTRKPGL